MASSGGMWANSKNGSRFKSLPTQKVNASDSEEAIFKKIVGNGLLSNLRYRTNTRLQKQDQKYEAQRSAALEAVRAVRAGLR